MRRFLILFVLSVLSLSTFGQRIYKDSEGNFRRENDIFPKNNYRLVYNSDQSKAGIFGKDNYYPVVDFQLIEKFKDEDGIPYASAEELEDALNGLIKTATTDVSIQDQTSATLILPLVQQLGASNLTVDAVMNTYDITVNSTVGMVIGQHFRIINTMGDRYYAGTILNIVGNVITLDNLIDFEYKATSEVTFGNINLAVNGSITPVHFHLRTGTPSIPAPIDITRIIMVCQCDTKVDLNKFGDLPALERGILFREESEATRNIFNIKTNAGLAGIGYDWTPYAASNPAQAVDGFSWRLTFGSAGKIGVVIRVDSDGQLGMIVQDDLTDLVSLFCVVEGHVVE
jgi:hypothetical protein